MDPEIPLTYLLQNLPEDQCIFIRGFRVARKLVILARGLKAAAAPNPDPQGDDCEPDIELQSIQAVPEASRLDWSFLVFVSTFEVPRSPSHTTRVYCGSKYGQKP
jgi:hypothetical protein